jgi:dihydropyrimidinase
MEHMLPVMYTLGVLGRRIELEDLVRVCCENNARALGVYPQKGVVREGSDADLVVLGDEVRTLGTAGTSYRTRSDFSIYEGWKLSGWPSFTITGGKVAVENGEFALDRAAGRLVPRHSSRVPLRTGAANALGRG